jgi:hypothetical protein
VDGFGVRVELVLLIFSVGWLAQSEVMMNEVMKQDDNDDDTLA